MRLSNILFSILILITVISCNNKPKKEIIKEETTPQIEEIEVITKDTIVKKNIKEEVVKKDWDSINPDNVVEFLTAYGRENKETVVQITTKYGKIKLRLYNNTPLHRANFIFLTKVGYFDTTLFYRVLENFVIQGGNSESLEMMNYRYKYRNYRLPTEFRSNRTHKYGALAAAREWENNPSKKSSPFEFYIIQGRKGAHHLDNEHTVFGEVISGYSTIDKIVKLETSSNEWPYEDVFMKIEVLN